MISNLLLLFVMFMIMLIFAAHSMGVFGVLAGYFSKFVFGLVVSPVRAVKLDNKGLCPALASPLGIRGE